MSENLKTGWAEKTGILFNNLLPVFGVMFLGWEAGPVMILLWLDGWLGVWEIAASACAQVARDDHSLIPARIRGLKRALTWVVVYLMVVVFASLPSVLAWMGLAAMTQGHYDKGLIAAAFAGHSFAWTVGLNILLRAIQVFLAFRRRSGEPMTYTLEEKYHLLAFKALAMFFLAFKQGGGPGLKIYVLLVSAAFTWAELYPERILHVIRITEKTKPR